ncbi:MAG: hypothetical protein IKS10_06395 [Lachnospiraceae bacterium]|nr:hypothetical protein [Lachnospiraceae bacterium]
MIGSLYACSAPKVTFPTEDEIQALVLSYLRDGEFANVTKFAVFEIRDRVSDTKKNEDTMRVDLAFVADDIYYSRSYLMCLEHDGAWKIRSLDPVDQDKWNDYPMAGVKLDRFLTDLEGLTYKVGGIGYTLSSKGAVVSDVETWENLSENHSGISMKLVLDRNSLVHTLNLKGNYRYLAGQGWIQSGKIDIEAAQKINALISDEMISKAVEKIRVEYLDHEYNFQNLEQVSWSKIVDDQIDHANNVATVKVMAHGETELLYIDTEVTLRFNYSDGWYFYNIESFGPEVEVGYRKKEHVISEDKLRETLIANKFRYGYAPDATLTEENIADLEITNYHILQEGQRQELAFKYTLVFERATVSIAGESAYTYDEGTDSFVLASRSSTSQIERMALQGRWYAKLRRSANVDQYLMLVLDEMDEEGNLNGVLLYRCVELDDEASTPETSTIQGAIRLQGKCDVVNSLRLTFSSIGWLQMTKYDTVSKLSGYFDFAQDRIASDVNSDIFFTSVKPEDHPDLSEFYNSIVPSGT